MAVVTVQPPTSDTDGVVSAEQSSDPRALPRLSVVADAAAASDVEVCVAPQVLLFGGATAG